MSAAYSRADEFLDLYRQLESHIKESFPQAGSSAVSWLSRRKEFRHLSTELDYCREVRNLLSHREKIDGAYAVEPSESMLGTLRATIERIANPAKAHGIMVPRDKVVAKSMDDLVRPAMAVMLKEKFSRVPLLDDGRVVGVFSETALLACLVDQQIIGIDDSTRFAQLEKYLPLKAHASESFRFVPRNMYVSELADLFEEADRAQDRIGMVFVTQNGKPSERLLGIITAWDIASLDRCRL
ncbi:MAG: CBS domain-containing protein [Eggerthellaceae bacterium]|nr:CBS domain-containing protein [Eggerthellaceae bacterium]